jgi:hypothetical protein
VAQTVSNACSAPNFTWKRFIAINIKFSFVFRDGARNASLPVKYGQNAKRTKAALEHQRGLGSQHGGKSCSAVAMLRRSES